jgi:hypothetical protein
MGAALIIKGLLNRSCEFVPYQEYRKIKDENVEVMGQNHTSMITNTIYIVNLFLLK